MAPAVSPSVDSARQASALASVASGRNLDPEGGEAARSAARGFRCMYIDVRSLPVGPNQLFLSVIVVKSLSCQGPETHDREFPRRFWGPWCTQV
jgi:hypothetical protein